MQFIGESKLVEPSKQGGTVKIQSPDRIKMRYDDGHVPEFFDLKEDIRPCGYLS
jgi:hypothetical protein